MYKLFAISSSALKFSNHGLMESVSDVIKKHQKHSLLLFVQCDKEESGTCRKLTLVTHASPISRP